ncbi:MAG: hypothetical protein EA425_07005 [Puniceicoccaceae bacterium]|nr:MAG: hypothetical protein EA425_07005 [Puniceicoccaceae bacterium]
MISSWIRHLRKVRICSPGKKLKKVVIAQNFTLLATHLHTLKLPHKTGRRVFLAGVLEASIPFVFRVDQCLINFPVNGFRL